MSQSPTIGVVLRCWLARLEALADALAKRGPAWAARFGALADLIDPAWLIILLLWFALVVPAIVLRGYHYEEGTVVALARGAIEDGQWLVPHQYGLPFPERPVLMSWVTAILGLIFGGIEPWIARLPPVLSLLGGGGLVYFLVRQRESAAAALFGAICFLISPALLQKLITAEPDVMLSTLLFAAFVVWWGGQKAGHVTYARWLATGAVLAAAALTKGPQPVAYFTLGVGPFLLLKRQWKDLPGFLIANAIAGLVLLAWYVSIYKPGNWAVWAAQSRLHTGIKLSDYLLDLLHFIGQFALELLPGPIVAVPFVLALAKKRELMRDDLVLALLLYAGLCTLLLLVWPGSGTRYAMPAILAVAALAGLGYARMRAEQPRLLGTGIGLAFVLAVYGIVIGWIAMPLNPALFAMSRISADKMIARMWPDPAPLYCIFESLNNNIVAYLPAPIHVVTAADFAKLGMPAWAYISAAEAEQVRKLRPDLSVALRTVVHFGTDADLYRVQRK
jgi:4-amino-4-deoxy-L-arabinose transferase-like glycosyltransferase